MNEPVKCLVFATALLALTAPGASAETPASDPKAVALAERTLEAMGGRQAWESTRYLRFNFFGFRLHHWDRYTGRHRLEGKSREGVAYVVLHNVIDRSGRVFLEGREATGEVQKEWLERAYGAWINDTYWLVMPYKLRDPGVVLSDAGEETIDGQVYDKVKLSFESVGLTPGDHYWAYLNRATGLMDRWAYHLEDMKPEDPPTVWTWEGWQRHGRIQLAPKRKNLGDGREVELGQIAVFDALPDSVFESPAPVSP